MKYIFLLWSLFQLSDFRVAADITSLEYYYKSTMVLDKYHEKFSTYLRNEDLQLALGPRSTGYAKTTLSAKKEQNDIPVVVMHEEDIRWNHLYLSATPYQQLTTEQNFANAFAWFQSMREMLNFRVGALFYKKRDSGEHSKHCSTMAAHLTMFQFILPQDRFYNLENIKDDYNREKTYPFLPLWKMDKDPTSGKDAQTTATNMEWMSKVTDVLSQVMDPRSVRRQYPAKPAAAWIFDVNERKEETKSVPDIVKGTLARDFYTTEQSRVENAAEEEEGSKLEQRLTAAMRLSESSSSIDDGGAEADLAQRRQSDDEAVESAAGSHEQPSERPEAREKKLSQKEKEEEWRKHADGLPIIDEKYEQKIGESYEEFYYKHLWKELLEIYGDAFKQAFDYFHFAITGDYVRPNMEESIAIWEKAEELFRLTRTEYMSDASNPNRALKNNTIAVLQEIEKIRLKTNIGEDAVVDENRLSAKWDVRYVDPKKYPADLKVHVA